MADDPNASLTIRLIMQGKEVGSIIGKKGEIVKKFREESGARINISDGSSPERIVTLSGSTSSIIRAFDMICYKLEEVFTVSRVESGVRAPITLRLIVPSSQCGSLIGKGGKKVREIREVSGASVQVASELLPNSTERAVTLSGSRTAISTSISHICQILHESPPKGVNVPYRPRPSPSNPNLILPHPNSHSFGIPNNFNISPPDQLSKLSPSPLSGLTAMGLINNSHPNGGQQVNQSGPLAALAALAGSNLRSTQSRQLGMSQQQLNQIQHEMSVPNELIGCIIGKGGTKIAEIRQISGAMIRISNSDELSDNCTDRVISITGTHDAVALAQYLINMRLAMETATLGSSNGLFYQHAPTLANNCPNPGFYIPTQLLRAPIIH